MSSRVPAASAFILLYLVLPVKAEPRYLLETIAYTQLALISEGYDVGEPDSICGEKTRIAIESYLIEQGAEILFKDRDACAAPVVSSAYFRLEKKYGAAVSNTLGFDTVTQVDIDNAEERCGGEYKFLENFEGRLQSFASPFIDQQMDLFSTSLGSEEKGKAKAVLTCYADFLRVD